MLLQSIHLNYLFILCSRWDPINPNIDNKNNEVPTCSLCGPIFVYAVATVKKIVNIETRISIFFVNGNRIFLTKYAGGNGTPTSSLQDPQ